MTENNISSYNKLLGKNKEMVIVNTAAAVLHWDMETKMPPKGIKMRSHQLAMLRKIGHKMSTDPQIGRLIHKIKEPSNYQNLDLFQQRNFYLSKKNYDEQKKLPEKLVVETSKQRALTINKWKKAKANKNFEEFKPELKKLFNLRKQAAEILMNVKKTDTPYDALIDIFEPKMTAKTISQVFDELKKGLVAIIEKCEKSFSQLNQEIYQQLLHLPISDPN